MKTNLKVLLFDSDVYGLHAIRSYLAWDRRTRVIFSTKKRDDMLDWLTLKPDVEHPNVIILDTSVSDTADNFGKTIEQIYTIAPSMQILVLERIPRLDFAFVTVEMNCEGYFLRNDVGLQIAWSLVWVQTQPFAISHGVQPILTKEADPRLHQAVILPDRRHYPELTDRIRQALQLCVIEGMSADLAADEMGVSPHTVRSYIKEGYRILEAYDSNQYPPEMSPQERAFMRFTAFEEADEENDSPEHDLQSEP